MFYFIYTVACAFTTAASAADWFFIAVLSAAMKKEILLGALCDSSEAGGQILLTHLPASQSRYYSD